MRFCKAKRGEILEQPLPSPAHGLGQGEERKKGWRRRKPGSFLLCWLVTGPNLLRMSPSLCALQGPVFLWTIPPGIHPWSCRSRSLLSCQKSHKCHPDLLLVLFPSMGCGWSWAGMQEGSLCLDPAFFGKPVVQPEDFPWCLCHANSIVPNIPMDPHTTRESPAGAALLTGKAFFFSSPKLPAGEALLSIKSRSGGRREGENSVTELFGGVKTSLFPHIWKGKLQFRTSKRFSR